MGREVVNKGAGYELKEAISSYGDDLHGKMGGLRQENSYLFAYGKLKLNN